MVLAVLGTREIVVYERDLRRPLRADGEAGQTVVARIPIGRPESADVLKASFAACGNVTWAKVLDTNLLAPGDIDQVLYLSIRDSGEFVMRLNRGGVVLL